MSAQAEPTRPAVDPWPRVEYLYDSTSMDPAYPYDGDVVGYYVTGHMDPADFLAVVDWDYADDRVSTDPATVNHLWWRMDPYGDDEDEDTGMYVFAQTEANAEGALPYTVVEVR